MNSGMNVQGPGNDEFETPPWLVKALDTEFGFTFDAAAQENNKLFEKWSNNVEVSFAAGEFLGERVFCNPPYSIIDIFIKPALESQAAVWVFLVPSRTGTGWFQKLWDHRDRIEFRFLRKRIAFCINGEAAGSPRFDSVIAIVRPR